MLQPLLRENPWYVEAFDRNWLRIYAHRGENEARADASHLVQHLGVRADHRLLDVGCGAGRYCRALAARGLRVTGVDQSRELIDVARELSPNLPGTPQYWHGDARRLPFRQQYEGAISMFTSFGYFDSRDDDLAIFRGVHRALVSGSRFVVDFLNQAQVRTTLVPANEQEDGTLVIRFRRRIEEDGPGGPAVFKHVEARDRGTERLVTSFEERVRLYTGDEVDGLLTESGFELVGDPLGHVDGRTFEETSPRYVRVVRKA